MDSPNHSTTLSYPYNQPSEANKSLDSGIFDREDRLLGVSRNLYPTREFTYTRDAMGHQTQVAGNVNLNNYIAAVTSDARKRLFSCVWNPVVVPILHLEM